jgi:hypothetical protein
MKVHVSDRENSVPLVLLVTYREEDQIAGAAAKTPPTRGPLTILRITTLATTEPPRTPLRIVSEALGLEAEGVALVVAILLRASRTNMETTMLAPTERAKSSGPHTATAAEIGNHSPRATSIRTPNRNLTGMV